MVVPDPVAIAFTPAAIQNRRVYPFIRGHRMDDGLNALERVVVNL